MAPRHCACSNNSQRPPLFSLSEPRGSATTPRQECLLGILCLPKLKHCQRASSMPWPALLFVPDSRQLFNSIPVLCHQRYNIGIETKKASIDDSRQYIRIIICFIPFIRSFQHQEQYSVLRTDYLFIAHYPIAIVAYNNT